MAQEVNHSEHRTDFSDAEGGSFEKTVELKCEFRAPSATSSGHSQSEKKENVSYTYTDVRTPQINPPAPVLIISSAAGLAQEIVGEGFSASAARVTGASPQVTVTETLTSQEKYLREQENYRKEQEALVRKYERAVEKMNEEYRKKTEQEAEKIRKEMEKQHERDIEFRKELMEKAIERQKEEIALEAKYARKELERQREMAMEALDKTKKQADVQVNLDTMAGHTVSESQSQSQQMEVVDIPADQKEPHKSLSAKLRDTFTSK
ncbi:cytosolic-abundant heat soluble protein 86272-like [Paramacrobiotus metropolitanus]|uniref:cytosolic-abundant heat soluble protein 86272-like n=1 Tax=Paramacrobiotus metropolitanus TaxID=2943436 RepID=UPI0024463BFF|nr:cytosolic-abundant heat soluble protein 86272-like [Paramacrobiotus metropolitanus]